MDAVSDPASTTIELPPPHPAGDGEQALKALAKNLARDSASDIGDRHLRARIRTRCYLQLVALLREFDLQRQADRRRYRRLLKAGASAIALLAAALLAILLI